MMLLLERKLQQFNFQGQTLHLDRINIQLGTVDPSNFNKLIQRFEKQIDKELIAKLISLDRQTILYIPKKLLKKVKKAY